MRIKGLLRSFRWVRSRLQAGLGPDELKRLREDVRSIVQSVEQICTCHGMTPDQLPTPSRRVVMYHELLHKKHGITLVNGRRFAHTAAFRAEERLFVEYEQAERFLKDLPAKH